MRVLHDVGSERQSLGPPLPYRSLDRRVADRARDTEFAVAPFPRREARANPVSAVVFVQQREAAVPSEIGERQLGGGEVGDVGVRMTRGRVSRSSKMQRHREHF